jgi:hypothetical protein
MSKNNWLLVAILFGLSTVYVVYFTDWFRPKLIEIYHVSRENRLHPQHAGANNPGVIPVTFGMGTPYRLTELKVVPLDAWQTNHNALPVWHLISDSNSIPLKSFFYGQNLRGMKPAVPGSHAQPLEPDVTYHLELRAGKAKGEHDFTAKAESTE